MGIDSRTDYATWRDPRDAYGVPTCAELLIVPGDLDDPEALPTDTHECPGCGNHHGRAVCPYCRMTLAAPENDFQGADA